MFTFKWPLAAVGIIEYVTVIESQSQQEEEVGVGSKLGRPLLTSGFLPPVNIGFF